MGRQSGLKKQRREKRKQQKVKAKHPFLRKLRTPAVIGASVLLAAVLIKFAFLNERKPGPKFSSPGIANIADKSTSSKVSVSVGRDSSFSKFRKIFYGQKMSYNQAVQLIEQESGVKVKEHYFSVSDNFGIKEAEKFYGISILPIVLPPETEQLFGSSTLMTHTFSVFETHASEEGDGKVKALSDYILTKYDAKSPGDAADIICSWTMNNVGMDLEHASVPPISVGEKENLQEVSERLGYGKTHNHRNSMRILSSTGVCVDYTNLQADLLNSVGIPSRTVMVSSTAILMDKLETAQQTKDILGCIAHSLLQVNLPGGERYYDSTPKLSRGEITTDLFRIESPGDYIRDRVERRHPDGEVFRIAVLANLPSDRFSDDIREILDHGFQAYEKFHDKIESDSTFVQRLTLSLMKGGDYDIHFWDAFVNAGY